MQPQQKDTSGLLTTIRLDSTDAGLTAQELVQRARFEKLREQIEADIQSVRRRTSTERAVESGLVYFIDGTRGAGKSTFLRFAYENLPDSLDMARATLGKLAYIDPSLIEANELVLLSVLHRLMQQVKKVRARGVSAPQQAITQSFEQAFSRLAADLSVLAPGHDQLRDLDPELFVDIGLERAGHSVELRSALHQVIELACSLIGVDAMVLAFDDADTNARHARQVLECIRKYLDTPRLVVLVTGDMELYSLLVRDHFQKDLGDFTRKGHDQERGAQRTRMVDHLEDQYLLKVFPIHRRTVLMPLRNLLDASEKDGGRVSYQLVHSEWTQPRAPLAAVHELIRRGLRVKRWTDIELYARFVLEQPLRSVLQVLSHCAVHLSKTDAEGADATKWSPELSDALCESLRATALGSLYKYDVDIDDIVSGDIAALIDAVFELALLDGDYDTSPYLRPQGEQHDIRASFTALAANVAALCAGKPDTLIRYMLMGPGSVSFYRTVQDSAREGRRQYKQYMAIGRREDSLNWAWHATALISERFPNNPLSPLIRHGVIGLNMRKPRNVDAAVQKRYRTVRATIEGWIAEQRSLPAFALSLVVVAGLNTRTFSSIYHVLGLIERLLAIPPGDRQRDSVRRVLLRNWPPLSISKPAWTREGMAEDPTPTSKAKSEPDSSLARDDEEETVLAADGATDIDPKLDALCLSVDTWLTRVSQLRPSVAPSAVLIGKIWTRLYFSVENFSESRRGVTGAAGVMEVLALCLINAFLVEELDHHLPNLSGRSAPEEIARTNPRSSPQDFLKKLRSLKTDPVNLPLTVTVATCPLVLGLLNSEHKKDYAEAFGRISGGQDVSPLLCEPWAWKGIQSTYIVGENPKAQRTTRARAKPAVKARELASDSEPGESGQ